MTDDERGKLDVIRAINRDALEEAGGNVDRLDGIEHSVCFLLELLDRAEHIRATAYAAAFADEMKRAGHGQQAHRLRPGVEKLAGEVVHMSDLDSYTIDAREQAHRWATTVADAAVESWGKP